MLLVNVASDHQVFLSGSTVASLTLPNPSKGTANPSSNLDSQWEGKPVATAVGDIDGDGDADIIVAPGLQLFTNDGYAAFTEATSTLNIAYIGTADACTTAGFTASTCTISTVVAVALAECVTWPRTRAHPSTWVGCSAPH